MEYTHSQMLKNHLKTIHDDRWNNDITPTQFSTFFENHGINLGDSAKDIENALIKVCEHEKIQMFYDVENLIRHYPFEVLETLRTFVKLECNVAELLQKYLEHQINKE